MAQNGISPLGFGARRHAAANLLVDAVTAEVVSALEVADVPTVLLKGPALSTWLYDPTELRRYVDIDLMVPPPRWERACRVLAELGFTDRHAGIRVGESALHSATWVRPDGIEVDLHLGLLHVSASPDAVWAVMSRDAEVIHVGGRPMTIPCEGARALVVAVKAIAGGPTDTTAMSDLVRALERVDDIVWEQASRFASELQAADLFAAGLRLVPRGAVLADTLRLPSGRSPRLHVLGELESDEIRVAALRWARMSEAGGPGARLRFLAQELMPSRASLSAEAADGMPGAGQLVRAYVRRLWRVLRTAPKGYSGWRTALRETGHGVPLLVRLEVFMWAQAARILIRMMGFKRTLRLADISPRGRTRAAAVALADFGVRRTTCLHRSVGRSQYMRRRGIPHEVVLGVAGSGSTFRAHAWLEPPDPPPNDFVVIHRVPR